MAGDETEPKQPQVKNNCRKTSDVYVLTAGCIAGVVLLSCSILLIANLSYWMGLTK